VFGETITFAEGLMVTFLGMSVVFLALIFLMVIIKVMEKVLYKGSTKKKEPEPDTLAAASAENADTSRTTAIPASTATTCMTSGELIAVISAAVSACMSTGDSRLVVRSIVRLPDTTPIWGISGRLAQQGKRL
jgi:sodium pump decarboxylase gamma subunit